LFEKTCVSAYDKLYALDLPLKDATVEIQNRVAASAASSVDVPCEEFAPVSLYLNR